MTIADIRKNAEHKMQQSIEAFKNSLTKVRTGRANPQLLDTVHVDYYGSMLPLSQVANLSLLDARTIGVAPWEKGMGAKIEKAIRESDLGLNPVTADVIRVPLPALTEQTRRDMQKLARNETEGARVALRNIRRDVLGDIKELLKEKEISEDDERRASDDVQKITDRFVAEADKMLAAKEAELMQV